MGAIKDKQIQLMDQLADRGRRDAAADEPHRTDEQLWAMAGLVMAHEYGLWEEVQALVAADPAYQARIDEEIAELREWYNEGRRPDRIDLDLVVKALLRRGYEATIATESGGSYLIAVGPYFLDEENAVRPCVTAGGDAWRSQDGETWCYIDAMSYGTGDPHVPDADKVGDRLADRQWTADEIAGVIGESVTAEMKRRGYDAEAWKKHQDTLDQRVNVAVEAAELAFWQAIARSFPEIIGGDLCPGTAVNLEQTMRRTVTAWFDENAPQEQPWAAGTSVVPVNTVDISREQLGAWTGRELSDDDVATLSRAVEGSSIPEALCLMASELGIGEPEQAEDDGSCGRCGATDRRRCDCVAHLCDDECGDPSHPRDGRTVYVDPTADQVAHFADLTDRAEQLAGRQQRTAVGELYPHQMHTLEQHLLHLPDDND